MEPQADPETAEGVTRDVGLRIREIRQGRGLTQEQAAERVGLSLKGYQFIERGVQNLTIRTLVKVATALGVRTADLFAAPASREVRKGRPKKAP
jgi:transcriptional regulator with XRE-family HTH domain